MATKGKGTIESPWVLKTPSGSSELTAYRDPEADPPALVVRVGRPSCATSFVASRISTPC
jgi:hypothetical protein